MGDYNLPLQWDGHGGPGDWVNEFLSAPFMPEGSKEKAEEGSNDNMLPYGALSPQGMSLQVDTSDNSHNGNSPMANGIPYSPQGMVMQDGTQFGGSPSGQQPMVVFVPVPVQSIPQTPTGGMSPQPMPAQIPGMPQSPGQWVLMPIEPTVENNAGVVY